MYKFSELILLISYNIYLPRGCSVLVTVDTLDSGDTREILGTLQGHEALGSVYQHLDLWDRVDLAMDLNQPNV